MRITAVRRLALVFTTIMVAWPAPGFAQGFPPWGFWPPFGLPPMGPSLPQFDMLPRPPTTPEMPDEPPQPRRPAATYCVRLCDGFFFPLATGGHGDPTALCSAMCPASRTDVYRRPAGSGVEAMTNGRQRAYSELRTAFRFRESSVAGCGCRASGEPGVVALDIMRDPTLRSGDAVVTEQGVRIFRGGQDPHRHSDFEELRPTSRSTGDRLIAIDRQFRRESRRTREQLAITVQPGSVAPSDAGTPSRSVRIVGP